MLQLRLPKLWPAASADLNLVDVNGELVAHGHEPLTLDSDNPVRFILGQLVLNRAVRRHYPTALRDGIDGDFAAYVKEVFPGAERVFDNPPGEPSKRVLEVREDLRELYPLALCPTHRRQFLAWLLVHGTKELGLTPEAALWHLIEMDESPDRGLVPTYLFQPSWQRAVPDGLTVFGWPKLLQFVRETYSVKERWLTNATLNSPFRPIDQVQLAERNRYLSPSLEGGVRGGCEVTSTLPPPLPQGRGVKKRWHRGLAADKAAGLDRMLGVNVVGHYRYPSGLQEACLGVAHALERQGVRVSRRDLPVHFPADWRDRERYQGLEIFDTTVYVAAVNTLPREYYRRSGLHMRGGVKRIAVWYWEVDRLPSEYHDDMQWPSEVWAPTTFLAEAYRKQVNVPVVPMLPGLSLPTFARQPRSYFGLPEEKFLVMFSFDMGSVMERKNPLGLVEAFRRAFRTDDRAHLCIKVSRGEYGKSNLAKLKDACRSVGATLIDRVMVREDVLALLASADCYASLHRAEGLGLGLAESMRMGVPVIGTAYSGNLDFMTPTNSGLVNATTVEIVNTPPYPDGSLWAEPDLDHAAAQLRKLYDDRAYAQEVAKRAQADIARLMSIDAAGRRMAERLDAQCLHNPLPTTH